MASDMVPVPRRVGPYPGGRRDHCAVLPRGEDRTVQVAAQSVGLHALTNTDVMFLRTPDGRTVAWVEGAGHEAAGPAPSLREETLPRRRCYPSDIWDDDQADARLDPAETADTPGRGPLDLARHRGPHPAPAPPRGRVRPPPPLGEAGRTVPAHPGTSPPRVSQPPPVPALPGPRAESLNTRTRAPSWIKEPTSGHPPRRGQNDQAPRNHHRTKQDESPQRLKPKLRPP